MKTRPYLVARMDSIPPVGCPCGTSRRAFCIPENSTASLHLVEISTDTKSHYHEKHAEIYYVLDGQGHLEVDGDTVELQPGTAVLIKAGVSHRPVGKLRILNIVVPPFDPADEHVEDG
jgi:mannose-6-phosphate isomerase-like protein (cupin superfamily)